MASTQAPVIGIYHSWDLGESGWNTQMDANLQAIDALLCLGVLSITTGTPPGSPANGDRYLIPNSGTTGVWIGEENKIAVYTGADWLTVDVPNGTEVTALDSGQTVIKNAGSFVQKNSLLGSYANDAGASGGGVAVGELYVNSSTGAITRRLV